MKKVVLLFIFLLVIIYTNPCYCTETNETIKTQEEALGISEFIKEAENYTKDSFDDFDLKLIYKNAITGNISPDGIGKRNI